MDVYSAKVLEVSLEEMVSVEYLSDRRQERVPISRVTRISDGLFPSPLIVALNDLTTRVLDLTPRQRHLLESDFKRAVDLNLLTQMLRNGAVATDDLKTVMIFFLDRLVDLQAPVNVEKTLLWKQRFLLWTARVNSWAEFLPVIPSFFEFCNSCIDEIKVDMANYYLQVLTPTFLTKGAMYIGAYFANTLRLRVIDLGKSFEFIRASLNETVFHELLDGNESEINIGTLLDGAAGGDESMLSVCTALVYVNLLRSKFRLDSAQGLKIVPEMFLRDVTKLALLRDDIDVLALISTLLIALRQTLHKFHIQMQPEEETSLVTRIVALIQTSNVILTDIISEGQLTVQRLAKSRNVDLRGDESWKDGLKLALSDTVTEDNAVRNLYMKRIYRLILRSILGHSYHERLLSYSLASSSQVKLVSSLLNHAKRIFSFHMHIDLNREIYRTVFRHLRRS